MESQPETDQARYMLRWIREWTTADDVEELSVRHGCTPHYVRMVRRGARVQAAILSDLAERAASRREQYRLSIEQFPATEDRAQSITPKTYTDEQ